MTLDKKKTIMYTYNMTQLTVGDLKKLNKLISYRRINYYDKQGLLSTDRKTKRGWRLFSEAEAVRVLIITDALRLGLSIALMKQDFTAENLARTDGTLLIREGRIKVLIPTIAYKRCVKDYMETA